MRAVKYTEVSISMTRQRSEIDSQELLDLANSIDSVGLLHPIILRDNPEGGYLLVAGERRLKAMQYLCELGSQIRHGTQVLREDHVPATMLGDMDPLDAFEAELEENIKRVYLTWQDRSRAESELFELRRLQAEKRGEPPPTPVEFSREVHPDFHPTAAVTATRQALILARHLDDPEVAKASSASEGMKVLRRKEEAERNAKLGESVGRTFGVQDHTLLQGNCLSLLAGLEEGKFDCILSDPPYGIDAQNFNDSGGKADAAGHTYDDSYENWLSLMSAFLPLSLRATKIQAHLYLFCDVDNFTILRQLAKESGWKPFRTPLIWHNPSSQRAPWPQHGPHRKYQMCLYATKGDRPVLRLAPDLVEYRSDDNLGWAAQKPVALYTDFLSRTCRAGDSVCDPFAGSGTIFPAAHGLKVRATGIELDSAAYGIAVQRLERLEAAYSARDGEVDGK